MDDTERTALNDIGNEIGMDGIEIPKDTMDKLELTNEESESINEISKKAETEGIQISDEKDKTNTPSFGSSCSAGCAGSCEGNCSSTCADSCYNRCLGSYSS